LALSASKSNKKKKKIVFHGYFSLLLSLTILAAALLWAINIELPTQYYLPASLGIVVLIGAAGFVILNKKIQI
jgi:hypothetical protein